MKTELGLLLVYKEIKLDVGHRMDFMVQNIVVVEIKSVEGLERRLYCPDPDLIEALQFTNRLTN